MGLSLRNFEKQTADSTRAFWGNRAAAQEKQREAGKADQGERGSVTAGKNMDGFIALLMDIVRSNGLKDAEIHQKRAVLTLPGYFRPTKLWDLLVTRHGHLIAAIELKSHVGPSFSNNFNNRAEEAIGTAHDFWTAHRKGAFGEYHPPFVGWLIMVEECEKSRRPTRSALPSHFSVFPEFKGTSYLERYDILCRKLVEERLYGAASVVASERSAVDSGKFRDISELTSLKSFVASFAGHVAAEAARSQG